MADNASDPPPSPARLQVFGRQDLRDRQGREISAILKGPKRLALLAYLVLARPHGFHRRDTLLALFWPDSDQEQARGSLRQALHLLRRSLGAEAIPSRGDEELCADPELISCDATDFERQLAAGERRKALELYRGPLLDGFYPTEVSAEFERWLDGERLRLKRLAVRAAWELATEAEQSGRTLDAAHWARQAATLTPEDEVGARQLIGLLDRLGDRAGALAAYEAFATRLRSDFASEPSAETRGLVELVRSRKDLRLEPAVESRMIGHEPPSHALSTAAAAPTNATLSQAPHRRWLVPALSLIGLGIVAGLWTSHHSAGPPPVLAVGAVVEPAGADSSGLARVLPDLLATELAQLADVRVVSRARLYDVLGQLGDSALTPELTATVARRAGATELVEATLYRTGEDNLRLDLRRVELQSGTVRHAYSVVGRSAFELADRATRAVAADLSVAAPGVAVAESTATSLAARRFYDEGLSRYYRGELQAAAELFESALAEDSGFALAAYYAAESRMNDDPPAALRLLRRALELSDRVPARERLTIRLEWAFATNDTSMVALADSALAGSPDDAETRYAAARARSWSGDPLASIPSFRRVIALDSLGLRGSVPRCRACDAYGGLIEAYVQLDSLPAAERAAREFVAARPGSGPASVVLATLVARQGRGAEAIATLDRGGRMLQEPVGQVWSAYLQLTSDDAQEAEKHLASLIAYGTREVRWEALWAMVIAQRARGELAQALYSARRLKALSDSMAVPGSPNDGGRLAEAQVLLELGRATEASRAFRSLLPPTLGTRLTGVEARDRAWGLARVAVALAAGGDTVALIPLVDSVRFWGERSAYSRDRGLPAFVAGLVASARGQRDSAVHAYRRAIILPGSGFSRINYELARTLLALGRPVEAIRVLQAVLHRDVQASNYYLPRPESHLLLAQAFDSTGARDSAATHYRLVATAWAEGDPPFRQRAAMARNRANQLQP